MFIGLQNIKREKRGKMKEVVTFEVKVPFSIKKKGDVFVSCCPVFDLWSQGDSFDEAKKNIAEALKLFVTTCFERGTLNEVLKECGFKLRKKTTKLPEDRRFIKVPIPFDVTGCHPAVCHA